MLYSLYIYGSATHIYIYIDIAKGCRPLSGASCTIYIQVYVYINVYTRSGYKHIYYIRREGSRGNRSTPTSVFIPPRPRNPVTSTARITRIECIQIYIWKYYQHATYILMYIMYIYIYTTQVSWGTFSCARCTACAVYHIIYFFGGRGFDRWF